MLISKDHIWMELQENTARIGITDYAQEQLGNILFLNLPEIGEPVKAGEKFGDVESIKTVTDLLSPADGVVIGVNQSLMDMPEAINENPYESWLIEIRADKVSEGLMEEKAYRQYKAAL